MLKDIIWHFRNMRKPINYSITSATTNSKLQKSNDQI